MKATARIFLAAAFLAAVAVPSAFSHTVSNSYLTLEAGKAGVFNGQWDVSLRDLQFVIGLDDNGDGNITWGELKGHQKQIAGFAYSQLAFTAGDRACTIRPRKQWVNTHADGAYAVLFFTVHCPDLGARSLALSDRLLFKIDPTHRGILVFRDGGEAATALLSPAKHQITLKLPAGKS